MFDALIQQTAIQWGVPVPWIQAVIDAESSWDPNAYRAEPQINDASYGLGQLLLRTARGLGFTGDAGELFDPEVNIPLVGELIDQLRTRFGDDFRRMYSAYNSGDPDAWQTDTDVAAHTARALESLAKYTGNVSASFVPIVLLVGAGLLLLR